MIALTEDKLKREYFLNDLYRVFENWGNQDGHGLTMVINGKYGSGKSTLLGFIEEKNALENKFDIIKYDAWENNFFENPMIPILYAISKLEKTGSKIKETAKNIVKNLPKAILSTLAGAHSVDLQPLINNENIFDEYDNYKNAIAKFKEILTNYCSKNKTILLIDELDRCLPEYQIKVLEAIYHLLDVPNLIVVIALDKEQLETSIQAKFGKTTNTHGYLAKFIQYEVDLPEGDTYNYIISTMKFKAESYHEYEVKQKIADIFKAIKLPLRESLLVVNELNLICGTTQYLYFYPIMVAVLLTLKRTNNIIFQKFFSEKRTYVRGNETIKMGDTPFYGFIETIKGDNFEKILDLWRSDVGYGYSLLLHFIDLFYPIGKITTDSLSEYFKTTPDEIVARIKDRERWNYPDTVNTLIDKLNMIL